MAPNILLVVLDAVRRDAIEPYGPPAGTTPAIADVARNGRAVPHAYATSSWTLPSHASMFTGRLARELGLGQAPDGSPQSARPILEQVSDRMLPLVLRRAGYVTEAFSTNLWISPHSGFDIGYDAFRYLGDHRQVGRGRLFSSRPQARLGWALDGLRARVDDGAAQARELLTESIADWAGQPTFWFVNLCECHSPYLPPRPFNDLTAVERVQAALDARRHLNFQAICLCVAGRWRIPEPAQTRMRHLYQRAVSYLDRWLADVLGALQARGILDETLVIVTSDHGENFGEEGLIAHGFSLDQRLIHVPLVVSGPGVERFDDLVSLGQLPRLIAEAAGLREHPYGERELPPEVAVAEFDSLGTTATNPRLREFAERWQLDDAAMARLCAAYTCATDGRHKLLLTEDGERVFDLATDPGAMIPLEPERMNGAVDHLRGALTEARGPSTTVAGSPSSSAQASPEEVEAIERQMKLLGYM